MSDERVSEIRARLAAATQGQWIVGAGVHYGSIVAVNDDGERLDFICQDLDMDDRPEDRDLIANAPADLAYLLDRVAALEAEGNALRAMFVEAAAELRRRAEVVRGLAACANGEGGRARCDAKASAYAHAAELVERGGR